MKKKIEEHEKETLIYGQSRSYLSDGVVSITRSRTFTFHRDLASYIQCNERQKQGIHSLEMML